MNKSTALIFLNFLRRDFYIHSKQLKNYILNYAFIYPFFFSLTYGYIIPNACFNPNTLPSNSLLLAGSIAFIFLIVSISLNIYQLFDFNGDRYIDFQICILNPRLVLLEKILFSSIFCLLLSLPFLITSKLMLQDRLDISNASFFNLFIIFYLGSFFFSCYVILATCILPGAHKMGSWWRRFNNPLLMLGGSWVPWITMFKLSPILGYLVLINPILYITEGTRGALIGYEMFIPFIFCALALIIASIIFLYLAFYYFRKRTDHI